jgi:hypothetical protein
MKWPVSRKCVVACWFGDVSQQPMWPHLAQRRRCNHHWPAARHSTHPVPLGMARGSMPSDTSLIAAPRPFDPAGERPSCCVTGDLSCRRKGNLCAFEHPTESVLVRVHETKMSISEQTAPRKLTFAAQVYLQSLQGVVAGLAVSRGRGQITKKACLPSSEEPPSPRCTESARSSRGRHLVSRACHSMGRLP